MPRDPQQVQAIFLCLVELPPAERIAALARECGSDAELRERVAELLQAHEEPDSYLDQPPGPPGRETDGTSPTLDSDGRGDALGATGEHTPWAGSGGTPASPRGTVGDERDAAEGLVIAGRYILQEKIGEGGMGEVWVAKQTAPIKRKVALKLIKSGMDTRAVLQRFEQERQALALMDHPHIARVFDGGRTPTGQPFFVMELVNGLPLTQFCDELKLTPQQRLELFVPICQAVQHAHQKGIVHRDLKPANILVTIIDGKPVPKVIDFGVAKATAGKLTDETMSTAFGAVVGTLEYMSPEQASFSAVDVDTRADVYSLGVILYELLTGLRPFDAKRLKQAALVEMIRIIQEEDPAKPSTRLSTDEALPSLAAARQTDPGELTALLREDLDWVVMKCLEKQRDRRYETAGSLARDIQRYLAGEAVEACPPSWSYTFGKFLHRHQGPAIAVSLVLLALLVGIFGTTWGLFEAKHQAGVAVSEADKKQKALDVVALRVKERDAANTELRHQLDVSEMLLATAAYDSRDMGLTAMRLQRVSPPQRGWEWSYRQWQTRGGAFALEAFGSAVTQAVFSPDGKQMLTSESGAAKIWDSQTGDLILTLPGLQVGPYGNAIFSPDGRSVLTVGGPEFGSPSELKLWDARAGKLLHEFKDHHDSVNAVAFSPDGRRLLTAGDRALVDPTNGLPAGQYPSLDGRVKLWDLETKQIVRALEFPKQRVHAGAFSPDGKRFVAGFREGGIKVWDALEEKPPLLDLPGTKRDRILNCISFSPDGKRLLAGDEDAGARVLHAEDGALLFELKGREASKNIRRMRTIAGQRSAAYSPDGTRIVTVGGSAGAYEATIWNARTGAELGVLLGHQQPVVSAAFSPDGMRIVTSSDDATVRVWDARCVTPRLEWGGEDARCMAFSPDGKRLVIAGMKGAVWDLTTGRELFKLQGSCSANAAAFSRDGKRIVTAGGKVFEAGQAHVWDAETGALVCELAGLKRHVYRVAFNHDGTQIFTGGAHGADNATELKIWDAARGTLVRDLSQPAGPAYSMGQRGTSVAVSPAGTRFVTADTVRMSYATLWDGEANQLFELRDGHQGSIQGVAFSPDGKRVITSGVDQLVKFWDAETGQLLPLELRGHTGWVVQAAFNSDGNRIVTGSADQSVRVWDAVTGTTLLELKDLPGVVVDVAFSSDGTRIAATLESPDRQHGQVIVWETPPVTQPIDVEGHNCVAFSPDGLRFATGGPNATVYEVKTGKRLFAKPLPEPTSQVAFSQDGKRLVARIVSRVGVNDLVWDLQSGRELTGEPIPPTFPAQQVSPSGEIFARLPSGEIFTRLERDRVRLVTINPSAAERERRLRFARVESWRFREAFEAARAASDLFATRFFLERLPPEDQPRHEAQLALDRGALDEAVEWYGKALAIHPRSAELQIAQGHAQRDRGKHAEAIACYLQAMEFDPTIAPHLAHELNQGGHYQEALPCLRKAVELHPANLHVYQLLVPMLEGDGQRKEAIALLRSAPKSVFEDVSQFDARAMLAQMLLREGNIDEALASLLAGSDLNLEHQSLAYGLQAYYGREQELTASWQRLRALRRVDRSVGPHAALACCLRKSATPADLKEARALAQEGLKEMDDPWSLMVVGITQYRSGEHALAAETLQRAVDTSGEESGWAWMHDQAKFHRAMALFRLGKEEEARTLARAATAHMPPLPKDNVPPTPSHSGELLTWVAYKQAKALFDFELPPDKEAGKP